MQALSNLKKKKTSHLNPLPPRMYFHAFGGRVGTVDQLLALCGREKGKVYFGFAPVISKWDGETLSNQMESKNGRLQAHITYYNLKFSISVRRGAVQIFAHPKLLK